MFYAQEIIMEIMLCYDLEEIHFSCVFVLYSEFCLICKTISFICYNASQSYVGMKKKKGNCYNIRRLSALYMVALQAIHY